MGLTTAIALRVLVHITVASYVQRLDFTTDTILHELIPDPQLLFEIP